MAQQNTDTECLIHALAALCALLSTTSLAGDDLAAGRPMRSDREHLSELLRLLKRCAASQRDLYEVLWFPQMLGQQHRAGLRAPTGREEAIV